MPRKDVVTNLIDTINISGQNLVNFYNYLQTFEKTKTSIKNTSMGFIDGTATFVGNIPNIINNPKDSSILKNSLKVNFLFLAPIFTYYKLSSLIYSLLANDDSYDLRNESFFTDYIFYAFYLPYFIEYTANNFILLTTTAWLPLVNTDNKKLTPTSEKSKFDNKSLLIKPINFLAEQSLILFSQKHYFLKGIYFTLFSMYNGRCLVKNKLSKESSSEKQQSDFLAKHSLYIAGLGASYIFATNLIYDSISENTGFHSFFLYEAISYVVYQAFLTNSNYSKWNFQEDTFNFQLYKDLELMTSTFYDKYGKGIESGVEKGVKKIGNQVCKALNNQKVKGNIGKLASMYFIPKNFSSLENISHNQSLQLFCNYNRHSIGKILDNIINTKEWLEMTGKYEMQIISLTSLMLCPEMMAKTIYFLAKNNYISAEKTRAVKSFVEKIIGNYQAKEFVFISEKDTVQYEDDFDEIDDLSALIPATKNKEPKNLAKKKHK